MSIGVAISILLASNLLSLVDGSRKRPTPTADNMTGYLADALIMTVDAGGLPSYIVAAADDCYKYYKESIVAFTFMMSMVHKDMHHLLLDLIRKEDPVQIYRAIQEHFKGGKSHHVEAARKKLNDHRLGQDIERDLSTFDLVLGGSTRHGNARISEIWDFASPHGARGTCSRKGHSWHCII